MRRLWLMAGPLDGIDFVIQRIIDGIDERSVRRCAPSAPTLTDKMRNVLEHLLEERDSG